MLLNVDKGSNERASVGFDFGFRLTSRTRSLILIFLCPILQIATFIVLRQNGSMKHGIWSSDQWVRFDSYDFERDQNGKHTGNTMPTHCYYKIRNFQPVKGTFSVMYPLGYRFSIDDGSLVHEGKKSLAAKVSPLSPEDEAWVKERLAENPNHILLSAKHQIAQR